MRPRWFPRELEQLLRRMGRQRPVVVLTGARQTGKTSLARQVFPKHGFVTLDLPSEAVLAENEPHAFLARHPPPVIIDEVQHAPALFRHLKVEVENDRAANGRFVVTGSQKLELMRSVSESLAGRAAIVELEGLSAREIAGGGATATPERLAVRGGMPELWANEEIDAYEFQRAYVATYLERDLRSMLAVSSLRDFERFVRACALRSAQLLNKAELARDAGISPSTADIWLSLLQASNQIFILEPWFANRTKSLVKTPKLYVSDPGLLCTLLGIRNETDLLGSPLVGAVWETLVCAELRKGLHAGRITGDLFFYRDRVGEVDFVVHAGGRFELFEARFTEHPTDRDTAHLTRVAGLLGNAPKRATVCRAEHAFPLSNGTRVVPIASLTGG